MNGQQTSYSSNYYSASTSPCLDLDVLSLELLLHEDTVKYNLYNPHQIFYKQDCNHSTIFLHIVQPSNGCIDMQLAHLFLLNRILVEQSHDPLQNKTDLSPDHRLVFLYKILLVAIQLLLPYKGNFSAGSSTEDELDRRLFQFLLQMAQYG